MIYIGNAINGRNNCFETQNYIYKISLIKNIHYHLRLFNYLITIFNRKLIVVKVVKIYLLNFVNLQQTCLHVYIFDDVQ